jgi:hypothetical protein
LNSSINWTHHYYLFFLTIASGVLEFGNHYDLMELKGKNVHFSILFGGEECSQLASLAFLFALRKLLRDVVHAKFGSRIQSRSEEKQAVTVHWV